MRLIFGLLLTPLMRINNMVDDIINNTYIMNNSNSNSNVINNNTNNRSGLDERPVIKGEPPLEKIISNHNKLQKLKILEKSGVSNNNLDLAKEILDDFNDEFSIRGIHMRNGGLMSDW